MLDKHLESDGWHTETLFYRGLDRVSIDSGASFAWSIVISNKSQATLLSRDLKSFEGGGIEYRVWLAGITTTVEHSATPILIPARSDSETLFRRVDSYSLGDAVLSDFDEIHVTGSGNNAIGGAAGGQSRRTQPKGATFILVATNTSNAARTVTLALTWIEGDKYLYKDYV